MNLKYKLLYVVLFGVVVSCGDITTKNINPKLASSVPPETLVSNAQKGLFDIMTSGNVNSNIFRLLSQQWAETTYTDESRYDLGTRNIPQNFWNPFYRDILRDLNEAKGLITADNTSTNYLADPKLKPNQLAIIDILQVYAFHILVNTYGDIPYTEALNFNNLTPKYESAPVIFDDLIARLNADLAALDVTSTSFGSADLMYAGSISKWRKFGNSLKLRMGMTLADADFAKSKGIVESAFASTAGLILTNADNAKLNYLAAPPNTNPVWVDLVQSGRQDFVGANTIIDIMNPLLDPRLPLYFTFDQTGSAYSGGLYGKSNNYAKYSKPSTKVTVETAPGVLIDAAEMEFYLAEGVARGMVITGTADTHYANAITANITYWGGTATDATTYLANPAVAYATATGTYKQKIGTQKWLALFNRGVEAWIEYRRLDFPVLNVVATPIGPFPTRYTYPVGEQNLNKTNYSAAAAAQAGGQDLVTNKVFWDKF